MNFEDVKHKVKLKADATRYKAERVKEAIADWARENPAEAASALVGIITVGGGAGVELAKRHRKKKETEEEENARNCRVWDPEMGIYWDTRKPMNQRQKLEYSRRVNMGEARGDVLDSMKLL